MERCFARKCLFKKTLCTFAFPKCHQGKKNPHYCQSCADIISDTRTQTKLSCCNQAISWFETKLLAKPQPFHTGCIQNREQGDSDSRNLIPRCWSTRARPALQSSPGSQRGAGAALLAPTLG